MTMQRHLPLKERVSQTRQLIFQNAPITYVEIAKHMGTTTSNISRYVRELIINGEVRAYSIQLSTAQGKYARSDLFEDGLLKLQSNNVVIDPSNHVHVSRFAQLVLENIKPIDTTGKKNAVSYRLKNMLPEPVYELVEEKLKRN